MHIARPVSHYSVCVTLCVPVVIPVGWRVGSSWSQSFFVLLPSSWSSSSSIAAMPGTDARNRNRIWRHHMSAGRASVSRITWYLIVDEVVLTSFSCPTRCVAVAGTWTCRLKYVAVTRLVSNTGKKYCNSNTNTFSNTVKQSTSIGSGHLVSHNSTSQLSIVQSYNYN